MKKLAITALAALIGVLGVVSTASANSRDGDEYWRDGDRDGRRHADRGDDWGRGDRDDWRRRDRDRDHDGWRRHHWRHDHWRGPRVVIRRHFRDDYCFVKKVRRYDDWGNVYIKRIRICR